MPELGFFKLEVEKIGIVQLTVVKRKFHQKGICGVKMNPKDFAALKLDILETHFEKYDLVICDEFGYVSFDKEGSELLFNHLSLRAGRKSTIITTNQRMKPLIKKVSNMPIRFCK